MPANKDNTLFHTGLASSPAKRDLRESLSVFYLPPTMYTTSPCSGQVNSCS